jgi:hypothetical protein
VGADETFFGLPILVAMELASGFIFSEVECENRTYETWWKEVSRWFNPEQWNCRFMVSDGAKALTKLALSGLNCPTVPDVFHLLRDFSKSIGRAISLQQARLRKEQIALMSKSSPDAKDQLLAVQAQQLTVDFTKTIKQAYRHFLNRFIPFISKRGSRRWEWSYPYIYTLIYLSWND